MLHYRALMRIGIVSDIHCNAAALDVALDQLHPRVDEILVAGDAVLQYRFSNEVLDAVRREARGYVQGNHEMSLMAYGQRALRAPHVRPDLVDVMASASTSFEMAIGGKKLLMVHACPFPPYDQYLYPASPLLDRCADVDADFLVLGHTHMAMVERIGGTLVVNPGALGERGDPRFPGLVSYGILDTDTEQFEVVRFRDPNLPVPACPEYPGAIVKYS